MSQDGIILGKFVRFNYQTPGAHSVSVKWVSSKKEKGVLVTNMSYEIQSRGLHLTI